MISNNQYLITFSIGLINLHYNQSDTTLHRNTKEVRYSRELFTKVHTWKKENFI